MTVKLTNNIAIFESRITARELKSLQPEDRVLKNDDGDEVFRVAFGEPSVTSNGIVFPDDNAEHPRVLVTLEQTNDDIADVVAKRYAKAITRMNVLEVFMVSALKRNADEVASARNFIETI